MVPLDELEDAKPRSRRRRFLLVLLPAVAFVALLAFGLRAVGPKAQTGSVAPDFDLPTLEGGDTISSDALKGRPVVLNFWASWCIPCRKEAPLLQRAWERYKEEGVIILGVNIRDSKTDAKRFVQEFGITYPVVRDETLELANGLGVYGIPETFFVDDRWRLLASVAATSQQDGQRQTVVLGAVKEEELTTNIDILIRRAQSET